MGLNIKTIFNLYNITDEEFDKLLIKEIENEYRKSNRRVK